MKRLPFLLTFPRSGSHYFEEIIYKEAKINIEKSHSVTKLLDNNGNKQKTLITIIRDPVDSMSSYLSLEESKFGLSGLTRIDQMLTEYILMHKFLYDYADYVIDFNDLVKYPDALTKRILNLLEIKEEDYHLFNRELNVKHSDYVESSKTLKSYRKNAFDELNINLCYFYYHKLLQKKIEI
jgi:arginyl-tRNA--protein-N-Asp/Glu arginylyltransferase